MKQIFDNLINGNLTDAKSQAQRYAYNTLVYYALEQLGWSIHKATAAAYYLKNPSNETFQAYCDAK